MHPGGEGGLANPPGSSLAFQVYCGNQQGLFLDQELFMCLWQPSQSKTLPDGHNTQQPRPPRAVRLFPALKITSSSLFAAPWAAAAQFSTSQSLVAPPVPG